MAWHPPQLDLSFLGHEGLNRLLDVANRSAASSPIYSLDHLNGCLGVRHNSRPLPSTSLGEVGERPMNAGKLGIRTRLEGAKWEA